MRTATTKGSDSQSAHLAVPGAAAGQRDGSREPQTWAESHSREPVFSGSQWILRVTTLRMTASPPGCVLHTP